MGDERNVAVDAGQRTQDNSGGRGVLTGEGKLAGVARILLAVVISAIGVTIVTVLYNRGIISRPGPFVVLSCLPIFVPMYLSGQRRRLRRIARRTSEQLWAVTPLLSQERAVPPNQRLSQASDHTLGQVSMQIEYALHELSNGQLGAGASRAVDLAQTVQQTWPTGTPPTAAIAKAGKTAQTLWAAL